MRELNDIASAGVAIERQARDVIDALYQIERDQRSARVKLDAVLDAAQVVCSAYDDDDTADLEAAVVNLPKALRSAT